MSMTGMMANAFGAVKRKGMGAAKVAARNMQDGGRRMVGPSAQAKSTTLAGGGGIMYGASNALTERTALGAATGRARFMGKAAAHKFRGMATKFRGMSTGQQMAAIGAGGFATGAGVGSLRGRR